MYLKSITLNNIRNFSGTHTFQFDKLNIIDGPNGAGKTTLGLDSILFGLYGYHDQALEKIITKGKNNGQVMLEFDDVIVTRKYPTEITINNGDVTLVNNKEKQKYLNTIYKNIDYFRKFRMLDVQRGINILEGGKAALVKTLLSFNQEYFNNIKQSLLNKKQLRNEYSQTKVIYNHYPSEARLNLLNIKVLDITESIYALDKEINIAEKDLMEIKVRMM